MSDETVTIPLDDEVIGTDRSLLSPNKFVIEIAKFPQVAIYVQDINIPSVSLEAVKVLTNLSEDWWMNGDKLDFADWVLTFEVAKNLQAYITLVNWLIDSASYVDKNPLSSISILLLTNNNNLNKTLTFHYAFPHTLGEVRLSTKQDEDNIVVVDVTFKYAYFSIA